MPKNGNVTGAILNSELRKFEKRFEKKIKSYILDSEVRILGELKDMREEFSVHQSSHRRINDELQGHDRRIQKLETAGA